MSYRWLNEASQTFLERDYLLPGQTVEERVDEICKRAGELLGDPNFVDKFKTNLQKGWYSLSSPVWINYGTNRGLPISCFGSHIEDTMESILGTHAEIGIMSKNGGGTSAYFGEVRERGAPIKGGANGTSAGSVHFMQLYEEAIKVISQGSSRRGQCATYLPIDHPDINEFLTIRTEGSPLQTISTGVCVDDEFMDRMINGDAEARGVWAQVLQSRSETGYPYIFFTDNANKGRPFAYRNEDYEITHSNLCSEIMLPNGPDESFVCCLSSMNVLYFDEWEGTDAVDLLVQFLDTVITEFIEKTQGMWGMERARKFAVRHRALGIGWLGYHSYLQSKGIPFESVIARVKNKEIGEEIHNCATAASQELALRFGEPPVLEGHKKRNTTLTAIAPTKSSSFILGQASEGIEPIRSNYYIRDVQKGKFSIKNPELKRTLQKYDKDTQEVWQDILRHGGSVQHLSFMTEQDRNVFKTFGEITPMEIIQQAADRQKYIEQGQSLNLIIHPSIPAKDVNALMITAWKLGIKSLYYQISVNAAQEFVRNINNCVVCEG